MLALVLFRFGLWDVASFVGAHIFAFGGLGLVGSIVAAIALAIFVPGSIPLIRAVLGVIMKGLNWLLTTTDGAFVLVAVLCFALGFGAHGFLDRSATLRTQLAAQTAATRAAQAAAAQAHMQAAMLAKVGDAAARRAEAAEADDTEDQEAAADLEDRLEAADRAAAVPGKPARTCCALTAADITALARIGAPRAAKP